MAITVTIEEAVERVLSTAEQYGAMRAREMQVEHERPEAKAAAVARIMAEKGLAATPAEKLAETDPEYAGYLRGQRQAVVDTINARAEHEAARLMAWATIRPGEDV